MQQGACSAFRSGFYPISGYLSFDGVSPAAPDALSDLRSQTRQAKAEVIAVESTASAGAGDAERLLLRHGPLYECWSLSRHCCQTFETATPKLPGCDGVVARSLFGLALWPRQVVNPALAPGCGLVGNALSQLVKPAGPSPSRPEPLRNRE